MSRVLLIGATGTVGNAIAHMLAADGREVRALVRSTARARPMLPESVDIERGDIIDTASVRKAMDGCAVVYHAAGLPEQWQRNPRIVERVNVGGTRILVEAALEQGVGNFLYTSTIDVFAFSPGEEFDESRVEPEPMATPYERSKQEADRLVTRALDRGLPGASCTSPACTDRHPAWRRA